MSQECRAAAFLRSASRDWTGAPQGAPRFCDGREDATADHERLEKLAGNWSGTETVFPSAWDPKGGEGQATTRSRSALDGFAIDPQTKEVVLHWFDSMGQGVDEFRGTWQGDRLTLQSKNAMGHWRMTSDYSKPGAATSRMETSQGGKAWTALFEGKYTRAK